ncbi:MAG: SDR family oxidoreductase, partial [Maribacter sp.]
MKRTFWALILGGSSGLGLATAKKLASHGYHILIMHRDRRAAMDDIEKEFNEIRSHGYEFLAMNVDVLNADKRAGIISDVQQQLPQGHQIKVMVHSVAKGTLKPMHSESRPTLTDTDFRITFDAMALSLYDWTKALTAAGLFAEDTRIISFTSEGNTKA